MHLADTIALVLILSFVIETVVGGLISIPFLSPGMSRLLNIGPTNEAAGEVARQPWYRPVHFVLATILSLFVCIKADIGVLNDEWITDPGWNHIVTGMLLVAGSDRILALKKELGGRPAAEAAPPPQPIKITGTLTLDQFDQQGARDAENTTDSAGLPGKAAARGAAAG